MTVVIKIENTYEDGHESVVTVNDIDDPVDPVDLDEWWEDTVFPHTGDGHGADHPNLGCYYTATVVEAADPALVGLSREWD